MVVGGGNHPTDGVAGLSLAYRYRLYNRHAIAHFSTLPPGSSRCVPRYGRCWHQLVADDGRMRFHGVARECDWRIRLGHPLEAVLHRQQAWALRKNNKKRYKNYWTAPSPNFKETHLLSSYVIAGFGFWLYTIYNWEAFHFFWYRRLQGRSRESLALDFLVEWKSIFGERNSGCFSFPSN